MVKQWENLPILLDIHSVSETLGISRSLVYKLIHSQDFPVVKIGKKKFLIPRDSLKKWLESKEKAV